jgi:hypothetical protein
VSVREILFATDFSDVADEPARVARPYGRLVCAQPSRDLICESCRARIRCETLEHKRQEQRGGRR